MTRKRLAAAGVLAAAAVAAAAALWFAPHMSLATPSRTIRQVQSTVVVAHVPHLPGLAAESTLQSAGHSVTGATTVGILLFGLALLGMAARQRRQPAPVLARPTRRGRAPPSAGGSQRTARTRCS
jgi:hypothetical protein